MLPIVLRAEGRRALVVGGGRVADPHVRALLAAGLVVEVVAPVTLPAVRARLEAAGGTWHARRYAHADVAGALLAIAATGDEDVNASVVADARALGVLVCNATAPEAGDFSLPAVHRSGDLTFAVDGAGGAAFAARLAREIGARYGETHARAARTLARVHLYARTSADPETCAAALRALADLPIDELAAMNPAQGEHAFDEAIDRLGAAAPSGERPKVVCASRASALAMVQTRGVAARLAERGIASTILDVATTGDRVTDRSIAASGENVFVKELETALHERRADYAVHSCKDLPSDLSPTMRIAAISAREDARDAFCSERYATFDALPAGARVGTSSPRRERALRALRPDLEFATVRGNVDTRLRKLRDGEYDAIVLAMAGLERLHLRAAHTVPFGLDALIPAVGQGALAIETRADEGWLADELRAAVNDPRVERAVTCERAALRQLRMGCEAPVGIHARFEGDGDDLQVVAAYYGATPTRIERRAPVATTSAAEELGGDLGRELLASLALAEVPAR